MSTDIIKKSPIALMAERIDLDAAEMESLLINTVMPNGGKDVSKEQFAAFVAVANSYKLDPLRKEIYAFPSRGGGIQPVVSIDGWLRIVNSHPDFDGMEIKHHREKGQVVSATCVIHKKSNNHPTIITEFLDECKRSTDQWKAKPTRMLTHKAVIQCARYAFGLSGIVEQDEAEAALERDITPPTAQVSALRKPEPKQDWPDPVPMQEEITDIVQAMESAKTQAELKAAAAPIADLAIDDDTKMNLRELYTKLGAELEGVA